MGKARTLSSLTSTGAILADGIISGSEIVGIAPTLKGTSISYPGNDLAADTAGAQTCTITGTGFADTPTVYVGGTIAPSVTYVSTTQITFTTPAKTAGTYDVYVVNPGGDTAIMVMGISYSGTPSWTTAAGSLGTQETSSWTIQLQATSNSAVTYALTSGSVLPSGVTLSSSGLITANNVTTQQTFNFSVTATDAELQDTPRSFSVSLSLGDPYFKYTTLLLASDGTNAAQNNTFLDSSANSFNITRNGNTTQGSFSPYGSNWSNYFNVSSYLTAGAGTQFYLTGNCTVECWINIENLAVPRGIWFNGTFESDSDRLQMVVRDTGVIDVYCANNGNVLFYIQSNPNVISPGVWYHTAFVTNGSTVTLYVNGVSVASGTSAGTPGSYPNFYTGYARAGGVNAYTNGYISNIRVVNGTAVYTGNFTPPTLPLTAITNTQLLTCQSNRFRDNSSNAWGFSITGTPSVQRFNPFGASNEYSASVIGGSGYFDGSGDRVYTPTTSALNITGDFTIECWIYRTAEASSYPMIMICSQGSISAETGIVFNFPSPGINFSWGDGGISGGNIPFNEWNHIAVTRNSDTTRIFVNGVQKASTATGYTFATGYPWYLGDRPAGASGANYPFAGYISDARMIKNQAIYTANFTPPAAPLTAVANTQLLLKFTNAGIIDNTMMNNLETVGNAQISTSVFKYGTGSLAFDGVNDGITVSANPGFALGTGDFTIEFWINTGVNSGDGFYRRIYMTDGPTGNAVGNFQIAIEPSTGVINLWEGGGGLNLLGTTNISNSVWRHIAAVRTGTTLRLFVDGIQETFTTYSTNIVPNNSVPRPYIGTYNGSQGNFSGYIDDFRVTKGVARYTANFTPPTTAHRTK